MKKNGAKATYAYNPLPTTAGCTDIVAHFKTHTHEWTYTGGESDTITATCSGEGKCDITTNPKIRIVAPAKKYENDNGTPDATLVVSENWSTELGLVAAPTEIFYVNLATETLLEAAPQTAGDYMAYTVIAVGDTLYSAGVEYSILSEDIPEHERVKPIPSSGSGSSSSGGSSSSSSSTSSSDVSGSSQSSQKMWAQLNDDHTVTVGRDKISGASKYVLIVEKDGKKVEIATTSKTKITINRIASNNITLNYKLKVKQGGVLSDAPTGYTTSLKVYYKPVVKLTSKDGKVTASWKKVPNATGYRIYKLVNGKMKLVTETENAAVRFKAKSGKKYTFAVSACVNGEWTKLYKSDRVSITAK
ncbi:MAG: hypothetical protein II820_01230 [Ruminiclostridium sp.]|nr:hypothetical protein [Ruminiclostridium sp.]